MKTKDIVARLKQLGWFTGSSHGERWAHFILSDRIVDIGYGLRMVGYEYKFWVGFSISTDIFSEVCIAIHPTDEEYISLIVHPEGIKIFASEITEDHLQDVLSRIMNWALTQDIDKAIQDCAALPTDSIGILPLRHLASLAVLGNLDRLEFYQTSFKQGDRLGFMPYITQEYIDRALLWARQHHR